MIALTIDVDIDDADIATMGRQLPFVISKAMNSSMVKAQSAELAHIERTFTIRRKDFAKRSVKITKFAKRDSLVAELAIDPPGGREDIFAKFERGGIKRPREGRSLAIPVVGGPAKRTVRSIVADQMRPRALLSGESEFVTRTGRRVSRAASFGGAFVRPAQDGKPAAIFVRRGKHILLAYTLAPEAPIEPDLKFEDTVSTAFTRAFTPEFDRWWAEAVRTAR
jgi:hypothetical protein